jgi:hypothetical protein
LKDLLVRRFGGDDRAQRTLDAHQREPATWRALIAAEIDATGAANDDEVRAAAQRLQRLVGAGQSTGSQRAHTDFNSGIVAHTISGNNVTLNLHQPSAPAQALLPPARPAAF